MDTDTSANHASFNQNLGMWKAYGLLYRLLQNGIPVQLGDPRREDGDDQRRLHRLERQGQADGHRARRVGLHAAGRSSSTARTRPQRCRSSTPGGRRTATSRTCTKRSPAFSADVNVTLRSAPRIANEAINAGITIAYFNAAGIPDLNGKPWSTHVAEHPQRDRDRGRRAVQPGQRLPAAQVRRLRHAAQQRLRLLAHGPDQPRDEDLLPARHVRAPGRRLDGALPLDPEQRERDRAT